MVCPDCEALEKKCKKLEMELNTLRGTMQPTPLTDADIQQEINRFYGDE